MTFTKRAFRTYGSHGVRNKTRGVKLPIKLKMKGKSSTLTKSVFNKKKVRNDGPISNSYFRWPARLKYVKIGKQLKAVTSPQYWVANSTFRIDCTVGIQAFVANGGPAYWSSTDITAIMNQATISSATAGAVIGYTPNPKTQKVLLKSCTAELMMTNQTNDVVHCRIYDVVARRDISSANFYNPGIAWVTGVTDQGIASQMQVVGSNPFQTPGFTTMWQVEKVTDVNLHTGGHHCHRTKSVINHMFNDEIIQAIGASNSAIKGITRYSLVVIHGYPGNDTVTKTQATISTNACALDMVVSKQYQYMVFEKSSTFANNSNALPTSYANAESIINDLTGAAAGSVIA